MKKISAVLSGAILIGSLSPVVSQAATPTEQPNVKVEQVQQNKDSFIPIQTNESFNQTIDTANTFAPYVKINEEGLLYLNANAEEIGVSTTEYESFLNGINLENDYISKGFLIVEKDEQGNPGKISTTNKLQSYVTNELSQFKDVQYASAGFYSWGYGLKLTNKETGGLVTALGVGSAAAWVAAELAALGVITLPAAVPAGLIAAIAGLAAVTVSAINNGKGVTVGITWLGRAKIYGN